MSDTSTGLGNEHNILAHLVQINCDFPMCIKPYGVKEDAISRGKGLKFELVCRRMDGVYCEAMSLD